MRVAHAGCGGGTLDREGWYHFDISDVTPELDPLNKDGEDKAPAVRFDLTVMKSVDGQSPQGSKLFHRIYVGVAGGGPPAEGSKKAAFQFGLGIGVLTEVKDENGEASIVDAGTGEARRRRGTRTPSWPACTT